MRGELDLQINGCHYRMTEGVGTESTIVQQRRQMITRVSATNVPGQTINRSIIKKYVIMLVSAADAHAHVIAWGHSQELTPIRTIERKGRGKKREKRRRKKSVR